ncbi:unnamed protein product [Moneuplotes crassus]|uniref:Acid ceramidase N-terminal domain-containing protein n=1 Tax=Euplotes crassus TaxID=5936 RepID=A0AAD1UPI4_EUPCR|nr:unnamed protein product [Moneuplotes crassus]
MSIVHVPTFEINLDLPAEERYLEIYVNFSENIKPLFTSFYKSIPRSRKKFFPAFAKFLEKSDNEYYKEMEALAKIIEMEPYECIAVEHCCEFMVGCTSVLAKAKDEVNGGYKIVHGRNLDYPLEVSLMRDVLYKGVMTKGGKEIGTSLIFAGFQLYTSIKKGAYSISYNQRMKKQENGFLKSMVLAFLGYKKYSRIIQETLITCDTFDEAVEHLKSTPSLNECYLSICGIDRGVKITRDRFKARLEWVYADGREDGNTFDVQTNCDSWEEIPKRDNNRRKTAIELVEATGVEHMNEKRMLFNVMNVDPVCNKETVYSSFMDPSTYKCVVLIN